MKITMNRSLLALGALGSCGLITHNKKTERGSRSQETALVPPREVTAIDGINSEFDDFNAAAPRDWHGENIVFSSNRGTKGAAFDVYFAAARLYLTSFNVRPQLTRPGELPRQILKEVSTSDNERGPIIFSKLPETLTRWYWASDRPGGLGGFDLYAGTLAPVQRGWPPTVKQGDIPVALNELNSEKDDYYLTLPFAESRALFASNRAGDDFDIYSASWDTMVAFPEGAVSVSRVDILSSPNDDTAPYVDTEGAVVDLVFASNREGSAGQHDIYCSEFVNGQWGAPKRLDANINSPADEFRPSLLGRGSERLLMFSSNRPGGKGGYDLYVVAYSGCK